MWRQRLSDGTDMNWGELVQHRIEYRMVARRESALTPWMESADVARLVRSKLVKVNKTAVLMEDNRYSRLSFDD